MWQKWKGLLLHHLLFDFCYRLWTSNVLIMASRSIVNTSLFYRITSLAFQSSLPWRNHVMINLRMLDIQCLSQSSLQQHYHYRIICIHWSANKFVDNKRMLSDQFIRLSWKMIESEASNESRWVPLYREWYDCCVESLCLFAMSDQYSTTASTSGFLSLVFFSWDNTAISCATSRRDVFIRDCKLSYAW